MFVRYYPELPLAAAEVEQTLVAAAPGWLASLSTAAQERGQGLAARVGPRSGRRAWRCAGAPARRPGRPGARPAGPPAHHDLAPLCWEPLGRDGLLPRLDATIELGSLGQDRTQLAISAQSSPHRATPRAWPGGSPRPSSRTSSTSSVTPSS